MALKNVVTAAQALRVNSLVVYLYADPGIGKTSLAFTSSRAILFDFDNGAHRAGILRRGTTVPVEDWQDVANIEASDVVDYDTIILDTAGRMLDLIKAHLTENRNNRQSDGALKLKAQGYANEIFKNWIARVRSYGKDVIILAHAAEDKKGDEIIIRPDVGGKNRNELYRQADLMGYLTNVDGQKGKSIRMLNFTPSTAYHAKNSGGLGDVELPDLAQVPDFLGGLIHQAKGHINSLTEEQVKDLAYQDDLQNWKNDCELCETAQDLNELLSRVVKDHPYIVQMRAVFSAKAKTLDVLYDKAEHRYFDKTASAGTPVAPVTDPVTKPAPTPDKEAQGKTKPKASTKKDVPKLQVVDTPVEEETPLIADLLQRAASAATDTEASALMRYTHKLQMDEINQLRIAIGKRLLELKNVDVHAISEEKPSLMVRMQQASDSNDLSILASEIDLCDPMIQPQLWDIYTNRLNQLNV